MAHPIDRNWLVAAVLGLCALGFIAAFSLGPWTSAETVADAQNRFVQIPFDGRAALGYLNQLCDLGPRPSGSENMQRLQELLVKHFTDLRAKVTRQIFRSRHPVDGTPVEMTNLLIEWFPETKERYLICTHYDTRPFPDRDPVRPFGRFVGANDGGSGTALLMELGRHMAALKGRIGVDFVFFDGEELVYDEKHEYFLGSKFFAQSYKAEPPPHRYRTGVLLDMIGDAQLLVRKEPISMRYARYAVDDVWRAAARLGVREFDVRPGPEVRDDHLPLNEIARIPSIDLIDFDYPYWHTESDVAAKCSASSLEKVGKVVYEWLSQAVHR